MSQPTMHHPRINAIACTHWDTIQTSLPRMSIIASLPTKHRLHMSSPAGVLIWLTTSPHPAGPSITHTASTAQAHESTTADPTIRTTDIPADHSRAAPPNALGRLPQTASSTTWDSNRSKTHEDEQRGESASMGPATHPTCHSKTDLRPPRSTRCREKTPIILPSDALRLLRNGGGKFAMVVRLAIVFALRSAMTLSEIKQVE